MRVAPRPLRGYANCFMPCCLFLLEDGPVSPNATGGGSALTYNRLELVANSGYEVALGVLSDRSRPGKLDQFMREQPAASDAVRAWCSSRHTIPLRRGARRRAPLRHALLAVTDLSRYFHRRIAEESITRLKQIIAEVRPELIWAEDWLAATLAVKAGPRLPIVYSHHDWMWRVKHFRHAEATGTWKGRVKAWLRRRQDASVLRRVSGCVSASASEAAEARRLGARHATYFPITYAPAEVRTHAAEGPPRIVHLGGMQTTANRLGLQRFLDIAWPVICQGPGSPPELWNVGSLGDAPEPLLASLKRVGGVNTGFVPDLSSVLRPYDVHIIPWEHDTGTRTRIPLVLSFGQVLVSTKAAAACLPDLRSGHDCLLVDNLEAMGREILALLPDAQRRRRLGRSAQSTFFSHFTRKAVQPRFDEFISTLRANTLASGDAGPRDERS